MPLPQDGPEWSVHRDYAPVTAESWPWSVAISGVSAIRYRCRPVWNVPRRTVADEMLWAGLGGTGWIEVAGERHPLSAGCLVHIGRGQIHAAGCGRTGVELLCLHYSAAIAGLPLQALLPLEASRTYPLDGPLFARLHAMCRWHARGGALARAALNGLMAEVLADLLPAQVAPSTPAPGLHRLLPALTAMQDQLHLAPRMDALAAACGWSAAQFRRTFRTCLGLSPHAHLQRLRLDAARRWLREGLPVATVAARIGYREPATFSRVFKAAAGSTPSHWRTLAAQEP